VARTVGVDNIDLNYCKAHNIAVYHTSDYGSQVVAEHALALTLAGARHIVQADREVHSGKFSYERFLGMAIGGKTIGVVGTGRIGSAFIKLLSPFGVHILAYDLVKNIRVSYVSLRELLEKSDIVSIHVPLLPATKHLIGENEIQYMKQGSILVNTSRGAIIDTNSLIKNIQKFHAVCLDVVENEDKFTKQNPLLRYENVIITPHIGFYTDQSIKRIVKETERCIINYVRGNQKGRMV
jgi:lactate dehydrogenase-like 2-hydroxyacid dehydrogenase